MSRAERTALVGEPADDLPEGPSFLAKLADAFSGGRGGGSRSPSFGNLNEEIPFRGVFAELEHHTLHGRHGQPESFGDLAVGLSFEVVGPTDFIASLFGGLGFLKGLLSRICG